MALVRDYNALNERKVIDREVVPAVIGLVNNATVGAAMWIRVLVTDQNTVTVADATADYDLNDLKTIVDGIANGGSDTGVVIAKDSEGVVSIST